MARAEQVTVTTLVSIAGLHVAWAHGASFPFRDRAGLHDAVLGGPDNRPSPAQCYAVASALATGALAVQRAASGRDRWSRLGAAGVASVLAARAGLGFAGSTHRLVPGATSSTFRRLDRRAYAPLCLALAAGAASAARTPRRGQVAPGDTSPVS
jgi:hypothetical protein